MPDDAAELTLALLLWCSCTLVFGLAHIWIAICREKLTAPRFRGYRHTFMEITADLTLFVFALGVAGTAVGSAIYQLTYRPAPRDNTLVLVTAVLLFVVVVIVGLAAISHVLTRKRIPKAARDRARKTSFRLSYYALLLAGFIELLGRF